MSEPYVSKIDRRTALAWIGVVGAAAAVGAGVVVYGPKMGGKPAVKGYGTDPNLVHPAKAPWPRIMSPDQLQATAHVADFILPASGAAPSASALGVPDFIDEWVSAPYPDQVKDRPIVLDGLKWIEDEANGRYHMGFNALTPERRRLVLSLLAPFPAESPQGRFFKRVRWMTIGAYYTTPAGFKDIGYIGNVARTVDPGPSDEVKAHLDRELKKLGL
ncbi:gluconate 2-dehydrogenase subunit 3 family protein [Phenylobacterium sp.]|uniref:gluconate 2-dehydrogenase subunit 3 family protein n=1 Tax=Phenylobacterium sp. TaxID=1871053 RepID=UPI002DEF5218|nr:gluconate 2-dehydrogenase subunit 3 family protein [Phenylobacterium sp.]